MYVDDISYTFQVILKGLVSLALTFKSKTTLLKSGALSFVGSVGFTGDFFEIHLINLQLNISPLHTVDPNSHLCKRQKI